jgi:hypothetical protein
LVASIKKDHKQAFSQDKYLIDVGGIYETPDFISMKLQKRLPTNLFISQRTGKQVQVLTFQDENYFGESLIHGIAGDKFITLLHSELIATDGWKQSVDKSSLNQEVKDKLKALTPESNPVIVLLGLKEF